MSSRREPHEAGLLKAGWWLRVLTAAVFAFYVNYIPFHLITDAHSHDAPSSGVTRNEGHHHDHEHDPGHEGHGDHHVPHPSAEHLIQLPRNSQSLFICLLCLPEVPAMLPALPEREQVLAILEHRPIADESPPQPSRPRAPPTA